MEVYEPYQMHPPPTVRVNCSKMNQPFLFRGQVHTASLAVCTVLVIFVLLMGCIGNGLVLLSALKWKKLRTHFDVLILNLAGADFLTCTCMAPIFLFLLFADPITPVTFCGSVLFMGTMCGMLSLLTVVFIALHRLARVLGQTKKSLTLKRTGIILGVIWTISLSISFGGTFHVTSDWNGQLGTCQAIINSSNRWTHNFVLFFLSPVIITSFVTITLSYVAICWSVQNQGKAIVDTSPVNKHPMDSSCGVFRDNVRHYTTERHCCLGKTTPNKGNKAFTMCLVVILTIGLCWGPLIVSQFVELATGESIILYQVKLCGIALVFLNSALDPYIYAQHIGQMKQRYGKAFHSVIKCTSTEKFNSKQTGPGHYHLENNRSNPRDSTNPTALVATTNIKKLLEKCVTTSSKPNNSGQNSNYTHNLLLHSSKDLSDATYYSPGKKKHCRHGMFSKKEYTRGVVNANCSQTLSKESQSFMEES